MRNRTALGPLALAGAAALALLLAACGDAGEAGDDNGSDEVSVTQYPCEPTGPSNISADGAITAAGENAAHIIRDGQVRSTSAELVSFQQASGNLAGVYVVGTPAPETCVWRVTLDGFFYRPGGPPPLPSRTPAPEATVCGRIMVIISDTGAPISLSFNQIEDCG